MLQTIYEGESRFSSDALWRIPDRRGAQSRLAGPVEVKPEVTAMPEPASPLDLRTEGRMLSLGGDSEAWERRLQQELLLIQRQQQIQKQLLICEFQKQHERLIRQHQAQLQEHLKLQQELLAMKQQQQQQESLEKERKQEEHSLDMEDAQEQQEEQQHREKHLVILRSKERSRQSAVASTEVKQRLQDFLLNKPAKEAAPSGAGGSGLSASHQPGLWYTSSQTLSTDQSSPGLGKVSPSYKYPLPSAPDGKDSFPLRKTASEPNLKLRCRLKQKVAERRSSPLMHRRDGSILITPYKKRVLELTGSTASSSAPGSGPSSPNETSSTPGTENGGSPLPCAMQAELSHQRVLKADDSVALLSLYTSPSLPNITLGLPPAPSPIRAATALKERSGDSGSGGSGRQVLPAHFLGAMPPVALETKVNSSHQALLQHLLLKEQMRQQKILPAGVGSVPGLTQAMRERPVSGVRPKLPRHRPLNRTQSAPLPQSTLAQLVIQQQHQNFVEKQKQYQQQVHINQMLSQSIEQLRHPSTHLQEEEEDLKEQSPWDTPPPSGVIRKHSRCSSTCSSDGEVPVGARLGGVKVKEEPLDSEDEGMDQQGRPAGQGARLQEVGGDDGPLRMVMRAIM